MALYTMLVYGTSGAYSSAGPFTLKRTYENQLAFVPRIPVSFENMPAASQNSLYAIPRTTPAKRPAEDDTPRSPPVSPKKPKEEVKNANLLPLRKKRLPRPRTPQETKDNRKWKVTEEDIQRQIEHLKTDCKRVESKFPILYYLLAIRTHILLCLMISYLSTVVYIFFPTEEGPANFPFT